MSRVTKVISLSLPPRLATQIDEFCKKRDFTKSEFFRNAVRNYFNSWKETRAAMREFPELIQEIKEARNNFRKGDYISLEEVIKKQGYVRDRFRSNRRERSV